MRKQLKALIWASSVTAVAGTGIFLGTHFYGKTDAAKGTKIKFTSDEKINFSEYKMRLIDDSTGSEKIIGEYDPNKNTIDNQDANQWLVGYKKAHPGVSPIFRITKGFFNLNNKYIEAVSIQDWRDFAFWYLGDETHPGHLPFGPEAGSISTFEIVPGVSELAGGAIMLGGRDSSNNEVDKITFYPDSFFGTFSMYDEMGENYMNRLLSPMFPGGNDSQGNSLAMEFTLDQAQKAIDLINNINQFNGKYLSTAANPDPKIIDYWKAHPEAFTFNGSNAPAPYTIQKSSIKIVNGQAVQYYKLYTELFSRKDGANGGTSLLRKLSEQFPELMQVQPGPYIEYDQTTGKYTLKEGDHKEIPFGKKIGLPYVLKAFSEKNADGSDKFQGFGTDFLKYVAIHEYGHHLTLSMAEDKSEGGVTVGGWNGRSAPSASALFNLNVLNEYLGARSVGLRAIKTDPYGQPIKGWDQWKATTEEGKKAYAEYEAFQTSYFAFAILQKDGTYHVETLDDVTADDKLSRAFRKSLTDLQGSYLDKVGVGTNPLVTSIYNVVIQNSFDTISGTLNPGTENGPFKYLRNKVLAAQGTQMLSAMSTIWKFLGREISSFETNIITNILYSTVQFARSTDATKPMEIQQQFDVSKWSEVEQENLYKYLNLIYKKPSDYNWKTSLMNYVDPKTGKSTAEKKGEETVNVEFGDGTTHPVSVLLLKFFGFYEDEDFLNSWFAKGPIRTQFIEAVENLGLNPGGHGFGFADKYAQEGDSRKLDGVSDHAFFDFQTSTWQGFDKSILSWADGKGRPIFKGAFVAGTSDATREFKYDSIVEYKDWNPYDTSDLSSRHDLLLDLEFNQDPWTFLDKEGHGIEVHAYDASGNKLDTTVDISTIDSANVRQEQKDEATKIFREKLVGTINSIADIWWNINGSDKLEQTGRHPFKSDVDSVFSDYVYNYAETMTRDFVQASYFEDAQPSNPNNWLKNTDPFLGLTHSATTFEYFIDGDLSKMYATQDDNGNTLSENFISQTDASMWARPVAASLRIGDNKVFDAIGWKPTVFEKELISQMDLASDNSGFIASKFGIDPYNAVFGHDKVLSNGFEADHMQRVVTKWQMYYDNSDEAAKDEARFMALDTNTRRTRYPELFKKYCNDAGAIQNHIHSGDAKIVWDEDERDITNPINHTQQAETWAEAWWFFILNEYGMGDRTVSGLWRDASVDKEHMYGYIPKDYANKVDALEFENTQTHEKTYIHVYTQGTSNLFYLQRQGDASSRVSLENAGFASWSTDREAIGMYLNSILSNDKAAYQDFKVQFVDANKQPITKADGSSLMTIGSRNYVAENGKYYAAAPTYFYKDDQGQTIFRVRSQFNL